MRLSALLFTAILTASPLAAQQTPPSAAPDSSSAGQDKTQTKNDKDAKTPESTLPVSLEKIKQGLQQTPAISLRTLDERPTFRIQILERQKIEELLATLNFKAGSTCTSSSGRCSTRSTGR
jgi:hypothetical protein